MDRNTITYEIDEQDRLVAFCDEWVRFARENYAAALADESILHRSLWDFVHGRETRALYSMMFAKVRESRRKLEFGYRCDTPTQRRFMHMELRPGDGDHIVLVSRVLRKEDRSYAPLLGPRQVRSKEFLTVCSWCKRVELPDRAWGEVEDAAQRLSLFHTPVLPQLSHGICPECVQSLTEKGSGKDDA